MDSLTLATRDLDDESRDRLARWLAGFMAGRLPAKAGWHGRWWACVADAIDDPALADRLDLVLDEAAGSDLELIERLGFRTASSAPIGERRWWMAVGLAAGEATARRDARFAELACWTPDDELAALEADDEAGGRC